MTTNNLDWLDDGLDWVYDNNLEENFSRDCYEDEYELEEVPDWLDDTKDPFYD